MRLIHWLRTQATAPLEARSNPPDIYGDQAGDGRLYVPVSLALDRMEKLLLTEFEDDPVYAGMELQAFDGGGRGKGLVVIMYRADETVEFYYQPGVNVDRVEAAALLEVKDWVEAEIEGHFEITPDGVDVYLAFEGADGTPFEFTIKEHGRAGQYIDLLAPIGAAAKEAPHLFFLFLRKIALVRCGGTEMAIAIGGETRQAVRLPAPMPMYWGKQVYFTRYADEPVICKLNPAHEGALSPLAPDSAGIFETDGMRCELVDNGGHYEIRKMVGALPGHTVYYTFSPPLPDVTALGEGVNIAGRFALGVDEIEQALVGAYTVRRTDGRVQMTMHPKAWQPTGGVLVKLTLSLFPPFFTTWPGLYHWTAEIAEEANGGITMQSAWHKDTVELEPLHD